MPASHFCAVFLSFFSYIQSYHRNGLCSQAVICYSCIFLPFVTSHERKMEQKRKKTQNKGNLHMKEPLFFSLSQSTEPLNSSQILPAFSLKGLGKVISMTLGYKKSNFIKPSIANLPYISFLPSQRTLFRWCETALGDTNWEGKSYSLKWAG